MKTQTRMQKVLAYKSKTEIHTSFVHAHADPHAAVGKNIYSQISQRQEDVNGKEQSPPRHQSISIHVGPAVCSPVSSPILWRLVHIRVQSLCTNCHISYCFDHTLTNEKEQDKRQSHAQHRKGFLSISHHQSAQPVNSLSFIPCLHDTQNRNAVEKFIMFQEKNESESLKCVLERKHTPSVY